MSLAYHERIRFMQPLWKRLFLALRDLAQRLVDGIGDKP